MEHASNPAGRLWQFTAHTLNAGQRSDLRSTWSTYLDTNNDVAYYRAMAEVLALPGQIKDEVAKLSDPVLPASVLTRPLDSIQKVIADDIAGRNIVQWFTQQINLAHLNDLEACSHVLERDRADAVVTKNTLDEIRSLAQDIVDSVLSSSDLDDDTRETLLRYAYRLIEACALYRVRGAQALRDELDRFVASAVREKVKERVPSALWTKINTVSATVLMAVQLLTAPADLGQAIETYQGFLELPASVEAPSSDIDPSSPTT